MSILAVWNTESFTDGSCAVWEILRGKNSRDMVCDVGVTLCAFHCRLQDLDLVRTALLRPGDFNSVGFVAWANVAPTVRVPLPIIDRVE